MNRVRATATLAALMCVAGFVGQASAQSSGGPYRIEPVVIAGGGGPIAGGNYQITSTIGQPATTTLGRDNYAIFGGFWAPVGNLDADFIFGSGFQLN